MFELFSSAVLSLLLSLGLMSSISPERTEALAGTTATVATHNTLHGSATFKPLADVIGWQEVDTDAGHSKLRALQSYDHFPPPPDPLPPPHSRPGAERRDPRTSIAFWWRRNK